MHPTSLLPTSEASQVASKSHAEVGEAAALPLSQGATSASTTSMSAMDPNSAGEARRE